MDEIRSWLQGPKNYDAGAKLYLMYGKDHALRRVFSEPSSEFKKKKLEEALKGLLTKKADVVKKIETTKAVAIEHIAVSDRKWKKQKDNTESALHARWLPLFAEMMNLSSRLYDAAKAGQIDPAMKAEAGRMAHRICDLDDMCDAIYRQRDYYHEHKKLPEEKKPMDLVVDPIKIPLALSNAIRYLRDYKNKLLKDPGDVNAARKIKDYEWAISEYKSQLKID